MISLVINKSLITKSKMNFVSPYIVLASLRSNKSVILVNVLGDKIPFNLDCENSINNKSFTKNEFENYLSYNNNSLKNIDLVILYCASWSCGAAKKYYEQLENRRLNMNKIYDYKGAIHEWSSYSLLFPETYKMKNIITNNTANNKELIKLVNDTKHTYLLKDEQNSKHKIIKSLSSNTFF